MSSGRATIVYGDARSSRSTGSHYRTNSRDSYDSGYISGGGYNQSNYHHGDAQSYGTRETTSGRGGYNQYTYGSGHATKASSKSHKSKGTYETVMKDPYGADDYYNDRHNDSKKSSYASEGITRTHKNGKKTTVIHYGA